MPEMQTKLLPRYSN